MSCATSELEAAGENDLFAPVDDYLPLATIATEKEQLPVKTMPNVQKTMPVSIIVSYRGRTRKVSSQIREIIAKGLMSQLILGIEAVMQKQLNHIFPV